MSGGYKVIAEFDNAEGINVGTDVRLAGIKIGTVTGQSLNAENYMARVEMTLDPKYRFRMIQLPKFPAKDCLAANSLLWSPAALKPNWLRAA